MNIKDIYAHNNLHIQETTYSCGPCTILNVLHLKGDFSRTEKELIKLCKAKKGIGTVQRDMVEAAQAVGLKIIKAKDKGSVKDIERHLDSGAYVIVCYWHAYDEVGHYGLITQYDDDSLYFADCDFGFFRVSKKGFKKFWYNTDMNVKEWFMAVK